MIQFNAKPAMEHGKVSFIAPSASVSLHLGSCRGIGRQRPDYHSATLVNGNIKFGQCFCCEQPPQCPVCKSRSVETVVLSDITARESISDQNQ